MQGVIMIKVLRYYLHQPKFGISGWWAGIDGYKTASKSLNSKMLFSICLSFTSAMSNTFINLWHENVTVGNKCLNCNASMTQVM